MCLCVCVYACACVYACVGVCVCVCVHVYVDGENQKLENSHKCLVYVDLDIFTSCVNTQIIQGLLGPPFFFFSFEKGGRCACVWRCVIFRILMLEHVCTSYLNTGSMRGLLGLFKIQEDIEILSLDV